MPTASSIYWESVDSHRSSTSSGDARHYVDPWDLENYAYLRRHSVSVIPHHRKSRQPEPENWSSPREAVKEPGYFTPASVEELYFGPSRQINQIYEHYQPIYEDEITRYSAGPVYAPLTDFNAPKEKIEDRRMKEVPRKRKLSRFATFKRDECIYHHSSTSRKENQCGELFPRMMVRNEEESCYVEVIPPTKLGLNTYGHLKIDYSSSWDSLHRKITK